MMVHTGSCIKDVRQIRYGIVFSEIFDVDHIAEGHVERA